VTLLSAFQSSWGEASAFAVDATGVVVAVCAAPRRAEVVMSAHYYLGCGVGLCVCERAVGRDLTVEAAEMKDEGR